MSDVPPPDLDAAFAEYARRVVEYEVAWFRSDADAWSIVATDATVRRLVIDALSGPDVATVGTDLIYRLADESWRSPRPTLHEHILSQLYAPATAMPVSPAAVFMIGLPASGQSDHPPTNR